MANKITGVSKTCRLSEAKISFCKLIQKFLVSHTKNLDFFKQMNKRKTKINLFPQLLNFQFFVITVKQK